MTNSSSEATSKKNAAARQRVLEFFARHTNRPILIGEVALWLGNFFGFRETGELLESLVTEGILRPGSKDELHQAGVPHSYGYCLTEKGLALVDPWKRR
jgi:hypothetical protein